MAARGGHAVGDVVADKYVIDSVLGEGGMGIVYRARHKLTQRRVALKWMMPPADAGQAAIERFLREARAMGRIDHPSVVGVIDVGFDGGGAYLVMELLHGHSLRGSMTPSGIAPSRAVELLLPAMEGVDAAHQAGVVHRDLKPENLFVVTSKDGTFMTTMVLDFGISKLREERNRASSPTGVLTQTGVTMGTPRYMAPEQILDSRDIDARADIWALGAILYEMISGRVPYIADSYGALAVAIATKSAAPLDQVASGVPRVLVDAVARALERDATARFPDVAAFAHAIESVAPDGVRYRTPPPPSRSVELDWPPPERLLNGDDVKSVSSGSTPTRVARGSPVPPASSAALAETIEELPPSKRPIALEVDRGNTPSLEISAAASHRGSASIEATSTSSVVTSPARRVPMLVVALVVAGLAITGVIAWRAAGTPPRAISRVERTATTRTSPPDLAPSAVTAPRESNALPTPTAEPAHLEAARVAPIATMPELVDAAPVPSLPSLPTPPSARVGSPSRAGAPRSGGARAANPIDSERTSAPSEPPVSPASHRTGALNRDEF